MSTATRGSSASLSVSRSPVGIHRGASLCFLLLLPPHRRLPVQSEGRSGAALGLSVPREGPGGEANGPPAARHYKVRLQSDFMLLVNIYMFKATKCVYFWLLMVGTPCSVSQCAVQQWQPGLKTPTLIPP